MKEAAITISLCLLLVVGIVALTIRPSSEHESFSITIMQNGQEVEAHNGIVSLHKAPFQFVLTMQKPMSLIVLASHNPATWYNRAAQGVSLEAMIHPGLGYADTLFNSGRNLYLSDAGLNYWFYSEPADHRFDEVAFQDTSVIGVRTVEKFYYPEKNQEIEVKNCPEGEIYLVFAHAEYNSQSRKYTEHQRETLRIKFK